MQRLLNVCAILLVALFASAKDQKSAVAAPTQFEIGRMIFFDFGPPFDYYDLYIVRPAGTGSTVERVSLTPSGGCTVPAKTEAVTAILAQSVMELLENKNPCDIPEKELKKEEKRCKKCLVFSGATIAMQVKCGDSVRLIRSSVFDRDWFDADAKTPQQTSWTMRLLERLDKVGPTVMDKPVFQAIEQPESNISEKKVNSTISEEIASGKYDALFGTSSHKPSEIIRESQVPPLGPEVKLVAIGPDHPEQVVLPNYPPIARAANIRGHVHLLIKVDSEGRVLDVVIESGHPMLNEAAKDAASHWKFPASNISRQVHADLEFDTNCKG